MHPKNSAVKSVFILLFILLTAKTPIFAAQNDDFERYQEKLERVQQSIKKVKKHLKSTRYKRGHVVTELKQLESKISKNSKELSITEKEIDSLNKGDHLDGLHLVGIVDHPLGHQSRICSHAHNILVVIVCGYAVYIYRI